MKPRIDLSASHRLAMPTLPSCPSCHKLLDGATGTVDPPRPGNLSVCIYCAAVSVFKAADGGLTLELISPETFEGLDEETRTVIVAIQNASKVVISDMKRRKQERACRECGCTDADCRQCIAASGHACDWVEKDLCSRCKNEKS